MTRSILVTGASSGFGAGVAVGMARRGWRVFASMRDLTKAGSLKQAAGQYGCEAAIVPVALDVSVGDSITAAIEQVLEQTGGTLDALLNNAGYSVIAPFEEMSDADVRAQMETNFFGTLGITRAILPAMRKAGRGRIVTVTSNAVNAPHPMISIYAASKWALEGWAEGLAMEVAPFGIEVAVVQPGAHRTAFAGNVQFTMQPDSGYSAWMDAAGPSLAELDSWSREPTLAVEEIVGMLTAGTIPFRTSVGEDAQVFSALKGVAPYEVRAMVLRGIIGAPGPGAFSDAEVPGTQRSVAAQIFGRVARAVAEDPHAAATLTRAFGL